MENYSHETLLAFARAWYWIASDRVLEFDDVIRCPLRDRDAVRRETAVYVRARSELRAGELDTEIVKGFRSMLLRLESHGETVDQVFLWTYSLSSELQPKEATRALQILKETFDRFARGQRSRASRLDEDALESLAASYRLEAYEPRLAFSSMRSASERAWVEVASRRTAWDELLWKLRFEETQVDPAVYVTVGYGEVLAREWWRKARLSLTDEQKRALREEQFANIREFSRANPPTWKTDWSVDESMTIASFPDFHTLTRS